MVAELIIGYLAQISVLIADGLNNLTGVCGAAILITGLKISKRPPDSNHVMGHWQYENIAALLSATIMFAVSIQIFVDGAFAVQRFFAGHTIRPNYWSLGVSMIAAIIISILAKYNSLRNCLRSKLSFGILLQKRKLLCLIIPVILLANSLKSFAQN